VRLWGVQIAARHADLCTSMRCDHAGTYLGAPPGYTLAACMVGGG